jgi:hypothetical protein
VTIYRPGQRVTLVATSDPHTDLRPGATGTVHSHDTTLNVVEVGWDTGSTLSMLLDDGDRITLSEPSPAAEQISDGDDTDAGSGHSDSNASAATDDGSTAYVAELPPCDIHRHIRNVEIAARYDAALRRGGWAYMCEDCFTVYGIGLGTGRGQRLIVAESGTAEPPTGT